MAKSKNKKASSVIEAKPKKRKAGGRPFAKGNKIALGNKGNTNPQYDAEEWQTRKIDAGMVSRYITINSHKTRDELRKILSRGEVSIFEERIIKALLGDEGFGNAGGLSMVYLIDRVAGKVPDKIEHSVPDKYANMTNEELMAEKRRLEVENRKTLTFIEQDMGLRPKPHQETAPHDSTVIDVTTSSTSGDDSST